MRQIVTLAFASVLLVAALPVLPVTAPVSAHAGHSPGLLDLDTLTVTGPLMICLDEGFLPENGVRSGSGTPEDPFIISDWHIVGGGENGLMISGTNASFIVRNVLVDGARNGTFRDGIHLANVTGGTLEHVEVAGQGRDGVHIAYSNGTVVRDSFFHDNDHVGLYSRAGVSMLWDSNHAKDNWKHGFYFGFNSSFNRITNTRSEGHFGHADDSFGIYSGIASNDNVMDNNTLINNGAGIQVTLVERNVMRDNVVTGGVFAGISLLSTTDSVIADNTLSENGLRGIKLVGSERITVAGNVADGHSIGLSVTSVGFNTVTRNVLRDNALGIFFEAGVSDNLVYDNLFSNTVNAKVEFGVNTWNLSKRSGPNVVGGQFIGGNYWSDAPTVLHDHDEDGLYESHGPYAIGIEEGGDYLPIASAPGQPVASFHVSNEAPASMEAVAFTDTSAAVGRPIANWTWTMGDGTTRYGPAVEHAYAEPGDYPVVLRVRDDIGLTDTSTRLIAVQNQLPVPVVAGGTLVVTAEATVAFDASGSFDPDGYIAQARWVFGDGSAATGFQVTHTYASAGTFGGALLVVDDRLGSAIVPFVVVVDQTPPATTASIEGSAGGAGWWLPPVTVRLTATDNGSGVERIEWRTGSTWIAGAAPAFGDGAHEVDFRALDVAGNVEATRTVTVHVDGTAPTTRFDGPAIVGPDTVVAVTGVDALSGVRDTFHRIGTDAAWRWGDTFTLRGTPDGDVAFASFAVDRAGNQGEPAEHTVRLDATPPHLVVTNPPRQGVASGGFALPLGFAKAHVTGLGQAAVVVGGFTLAGQADDAVAGLASVTVTLDGEVVATNDLAIPDFTWRAPAGDFPSWHTLRVTATDAVGNTRTTERVFLALADPEAPS